MNIEGERYRHDTKTAQQKEKRLKLNLKLAGNSENTSYEMRKITPRKLIPCINFACLSYSKYNTLVDDCIGVAVR